MNEFRQSSSKDSRNDNSQLGARHVSSDDLLSLSNQNKVDICETKKENGFVVHSPQKPLSPDKLKPVQMLNAKIAVDRLASNGSGRSSRRSSGFDEALSYMTDRTSNSDKSDVVQCSQKTVGGGNSFLSTSTETLVSTNLPSTATGNLTNDTANCRNVCDLDEQAAEKCTDDNYRDELQSCAASNEEIPCLPCKLSFEESEMEQSNSVDTKLTNIPDLCINAGSKFEEQNKTPDNLQNSSVHKPNIIPADIIPSFSKSMIDEPKLSSNNDDDVFVANDVLMESHAVRKSFFISHQMHVGLNKEGAQKPTQSSQVGTTPNNENAGEANKISEFEQSFVNSERLCRENVLAESHNEKIQLPAIEPPNPCNDLNSETMFESKQSVSFTVDCDGNISKLHRKESLVHNRESITAAKSLGNLSSELPESKEAAYQTRSNPHGNPSIHVHTDHSVHRNYEKTTAVNKNAPIPDWPNPMTQNISINSRHSKSSNSRTREPILAIKPNANKESMMNIVRECQAISSRLNSVLVVKETKESDRQAKERCQPRNGSIGHDADNCSTDSPPCSYAKYSIFAGKMNNEIHESDGNIRSRKTSDRCDLFEENRRWSSFVDKDSPKPAPGDRSNASTPDIIDMRLFKSTTALYQSQNSRDDMSSSNYSSCSELSTDDKPDAEKTKHRRYRTALKLSSSPNQVSKDTKKKTLGEQSVELREQLSRWHQTLMEQKDPTVPCRTVEADPASHAPFSTVFGSGELSPILEITSPDTDGPPMRSPRISKKSVMSEFEYRNSISSPQAKLLICGGFNERPSLHTDASAFSPTRTNLDCNLTRTLYAGSDCSSTAARANKLESPVRLNVCDYMIKTSKY